jgi:hypothetical protein
MPTELPGARQDASDQADGRSPGSNGALRRINAPADGTPSGGCPRCPSLSRLPPRWRDSSGGWAADAYPLLPVAARPASSRATGTRKGEQDT